MTSHRRKMLAALLRRLASELTAGLFSSEKSRVVDAVTVLLDYLKDRKAAP